MGERVGWPFKGRNGVGLELMNALPDLLHANVLACNNIRPNTCTFYQFLGWKAERLPHYYRLGRRKDYQLAQTAAVHTAPGPARFRAGKSRGRG